MEWLALRFGQAAPQHQLGSESSQQQGVQQDSFAIFGQLHKFNNVRKSSNISCALIAARVHAWIIPSACPTQAYRVLYSCPSTPLGVLRMLTEPLRLICILFHLHGRRQHGNRLHSICPANCRQQSDNPIASLPAGRFPRRITNDACSLQTAVRQPGLLKRLPGRKPCTQVTSGSRAAACWLSAIYRSCRKGTQSGLISILMPPVFPSHSRTHPVCPMP